MTKLLKTKTTKKGFTLMEMLIVVAIIAILVAIAVPVLTARLNDAKQSADDANIRTAYTEKVLQDFKTISEETEVSANTTPGGETTITFSDGSTYTLQYYKGIDTAVTPWKGIEK